MKLFRPLLAGLGALALGLTAHAAGGAKHAHAPEDGWKFAKVPAGKLDKDSVQRGFQVYQEVCASCHGMKLLSYRNLGEKGGPFYSSDYSNANDNPLVKAIAAEIEILDPNGNDLGFAGNNSMVTVNGSSNPTGFTLSLPDINANQNDNVCLPVTVNDFTDILGMQFSMKLQ